MEDSLHKDQSRFIAIPKLFYSDLTGLPISNCVTCDKNLLESQEPYIVEKAFRYYPEYQIHNTIFEYVMCLPCAQKMHEAMSKESIQRIQQYFSKINLPKRSEKIWGNSGNNFEAWISNCIINNSPRESQEEYQICAQCIGDKMVFDLFPYMISFDASSEITNLLSAKTLDEYNRFVDENFGLPPEFRKAIKDNPSILI